MIAGYLGNSDNVDRAMCRFAHGYAEQTERDYQALLTAVAHGVLDGPPNDQLPSHPTSVRIMRLPEVTSSGLYRPQQQQPSSH
jgi:hypothetical protein